MGPTCRSLFLSLSVHLLPPVPPGCGAATRRGSCTEAEAENDPFDVIHSESVAMFHCWARDVPNLVVSWHGISLEALHSRIYQDLTRGDDERMSPASNHSLAQSVYRVLSEVHFFRSYVHHVAISDTTGEMLRDVYQIPNRRVHVILNGVDEAHFEPEAALGRAFREDLRLPKGANLVLGVSGRLVKGADLPPSTVGRSPPPLLPFLFPFTIGFASPRRVHFSPFPFPSTSESGHQRHHHSRPELSSLCCRSGHLLLPLCLTPPSPDARRPGTLSATNVADPWPPEH
uniref:Glycosyltransferase subfamily 4-like N-terminal domain-containing protein n=1 Tax=Oryza glumipatula TaxID=40148 RepID=A0A0E0AVT3_9ORYZ